MSQQIEMMCMCGHKRLLWPDVRNGACPVCRSDMDIAREVKSGAIESVTQWADCQRITRNLQRWKVRYGPGAGEHRCCMWCGVTLISKRRDAKTCGAACRKALSRCGVNYRLIAAFIPERRLLY